MQETSYLKMLNTEPRTIILGKPLSIYSVGFQRFPQLVCTRLSSCCNISSESIFILGISVFLTLLFLYKCHRQMTFTKYDLNLFQVHVNLVWSTYLQFFLNIWLSMKTKQTKVSCKHATS